MYSFIEHLSIFITGYLSTTNLLITPLDCGSHNWWGEQQRAETWKMNHLLSLSCRRWPTVSAAVIHVTYSRMSISLNLMPAQKTWLELGRLFCWKALNKIFVVYCMDLRGCSQLAVAISIIIQMVIYPISNRSAQRRINIGNCVSALKSTTQSSLIIQICGNITRKTTCYNGNTEEAGILRDHIFSTWDR